MEITRFLRRDDVVIDLPASNKEAALRSLAQHASASLSLDRKTIAQALIARESLGSTGLGDGIAIPHARLEGVSAPYGVLARLKRPIAFDAVDGEPVDILFLLLLPLTSGAGSQLNALAFAARCLRTEGVQQAIRQAPDAKAIYDLMTARNEQA